MTKKNLNDYLADKEFDSEYVNIYRFAQTNFGINIAYNKNEFARFNVKPDVFLYENEAQCDIIIMVIYLDVDIMCIKELNGDYMWISEDSYNKMKEYFMNLKADAKSPIYFNIDKYDID